VATLIALGVLAFFVALGAAWFVILLEIVKGFRD